VTRWRAVLIGSAATMLVGCTRVLGGSAELPATETPGPMLPAGVNVGEVLLDISRMRGITGADTDLNIIPSMDATSPVDIDQLAEAAPKQCRFFFADTATFGPEFTQFHKTTFQYPPKHALISEGAAAYPDADTARRAFDSLVAVVGDCSGSSTGMMLVGEWGTDPESLYTRSGLCGRDYRIKSAVLLEVTFCGFPESVSEIVITNMAANVPD
jgi:hypothetical protein